MDRELEEGVGGDRSEASRLVLASGGPHGPQLHSMIHGERRKGWSDSRSDSPVSRAPPRIPIITPSSPADLQPPKAARACRVQIGQLGL